MHGQQGTSAQPVRVLLADDSPAVVDALVGLLATFEGVSVAGTASDGRVAVDKALELLPDLVLLDLVMPRMDGLRAAERIRSQLPSVKIVVMSFYDQDAIRLAAEDRSDGFISKTELGTALARKIQELFPGHAH